MYNRLTQQVRKRIIRELRRYWAYDPRYRDDLVPHIQDRFSFKERPCMGMIVKGGGANHFQLSADNFQGTVVSYVALAKVGDNPGLAIEWVREDIRAIIENGGVFPSLPGIYYIEVREEEVNWQGVTANHKVFYVDPLLEVIDEAPLFITPFEYHLLHAPLHAGSLRLWELPGNIPLVEGINYTIDYTTGVITLAEVLPQGVSLSADYRYPGESTGPYVIQENFSNVRAIPGVVLAFGRRASAGDIMCILVGDRRQPVALEYGGRWDTTLDIDIFAKSIAEQGEITDQTLLYLHGVARNHLSTEGIEIVEVSSGGEAEETYDENADDYFYTSSISMSIQTDWAIHVPLAETIQRVIPQTKAEAESVAGLTDEQLVDAEPNALKAVQNLNLIKVQDPFFVGRNKTYEVIK